MNIDEARVRDILRVLCRVPVPRGQLVLYRAARHAGAGGFSSVDVQRDIQYDGAQFRGLMAAFATRINRSPRETYQGRKPGVDLMFVQKWVDNQSRYTPRPELLAAIDRLPGLAVRLDAPLSEILAGGSVAESLPPGIPPIPVVKLQPPPALPFQQLLRSLDDGGLHFPGETVANVLLALQIKRFVILTGISGTGKTRIAQAIAGRYPLSRKVVLPPSTDDRTAVVTVAPYVKKHRRIVLPAALADQLTETQRQGSGTFRARWPGGSLEVSTYRGSAFALMFKGELRAWMDANFKDGDALVLRLEGSAEGAFDTVVFEKPTGGMEREQLLTHQQIIPVRPDWTDNRGLLGFFNPLTRKYVTTPFLKLLLAAADEYKRATAEKRPPHPFFVLLDEMNLARVEHYFSDLLSAMESVADEADRTAGAIHLHDEMELEEGESDEVAVPRWLRIPPNLFIVGTVNVDESTYMFSPKVLDRAFTIEFNAVDLAGFGAAEGVTNDLEGGGDLELTRWDGRLPPPRAASRDDWQWLTTFRAGELQKQLLAIQELLNATHRHFGYRVACEIARFVRLAVEQVDDNDSAAEDAARAALDLALMQKVLVKLAGSQGELAGLLDELFWFAIAGRVTEKDQRAEGRWKLAGVEVVPKAEDADEAAVFPRSAGKLWRMRKRLQERGFTSWIE